MQEFKPALIFISIFLGLYFGLNVAYGIWIESFHTQPDSLTQVITRQTVTLLNACGEATTTQVAADKPSVAILKSGRKVIGVYEGCNSLNVMIVFVAFVAAFRGKRKTAAWFIPLGLVLIYLTNLLRVALLYLIAAYWSGYFYYFHKYLFTAFIYLVVFGLWLWWMRLSHGITLKGFFTRIPK